MKKMAGSNISFDPYRERFNDTGNMSNTCQGTVRRVNILVILFVFFQSFLAGQVAGSTPPDSTDFFASDEMLHIRIQVDLDSLLKDVSDTPDYHPARLYLLEAGIPVDSFSVKIRTRGNFRRKPENCNFPPLLLNFRKQEVFNSIFHGQDKLKLVTHCRSDIPEFLQYVRQEYLIYRGYNILTPYSFRVRYARLEYVDTSDPQPVLNSAGFFIEWDENMAARNGSVLYPEPEISIDSIDKESYYLMSVFQYMINNNDWIVEIKKNVELLTFESSKRVIPVPYDFDWAAMTGTPYRVDAAIEHDQMESYIIPRSYRSRCMDSETLQKIVACFREKKKQLYDLFLTDGEINITTMQKSLYMLNSFYEVINRKSLARKVFQKECYRPR